MRRFDRCIFISIAIGIWALAMVQIFKPEIIQAGKSSPDSGQLPPLTVVSGECPNYINV